ncbi:hypothetical protein GCM10009850_119780 [Nonomuraea monospora]|uniref:DUF624 domain-containing protein n=1 Tax=Nonomuraea monospora TaxID=568818 RepID=A0ABN3D3V6_9ACTN
MRITLDGPVARTALVVWSLFAASACFVACCLPYLLFERLIGWQASHGALWLGALSLTPVGPGLRGLLASAHAMVDARGHADAPVRRFATAIRHSSQGLRTLWWALPALALLLGYDLALYGTTVPAMPILVVAAGGLLALILIAASLAGTDEHRLPALLNRVLKAGVRRPYLPLTWVFLLSLALLATRLPLVGPSLLLFAPATWAVAVDVVNRVWGQPGVARGVARKES